MKHAKQLSVWAAVLVLALVGAVGPPAAYGATEQAKQQAIDDGLAWLASQQAGAGYWAYGGGRNDVAATASAAMAFVGEGYLPGDGSAYDANVTSAVTWLFNQAQILSPIPVEPAGYWHHAEDYNNSGAIEAGEGNDRALYFATTDIYSNGIVAPLVFELGKQLGPDTVVGMGNANIQNTTYRQAMQDVVDWFSWGQVEPNRGNYRGGWRYNPNYGDSDNSTAQWGALPILYADAWGLGVPQQVRDELELWCNYIQNANGGSGYTNPGQYVNVSKTGGLILELLATGAAVGDPRIQAALGFIDGRWNNGPSGTWYGNLNHPYAMWGVYKALEVSGFMTMDDNGTPGDPSDDFLIGHGMSNAPGGFTIGQDWGPQTSLAGDWFSHYCEYLVNIQNANGSWNGYSYWNGPLATGWYINILNAAGAPPPAVVIPEPVTAVGLLLGVGCLTRYVRRRRRRR